MRIFPKTLLKAFPHTAWRQALPGWFNSLQFRLAAIPLAVMLATFWLLALFCMSALRTTLETAQMKQQRSNVQYLAAELGSKLNSLKAGLVVAAAQLDTHRLNDKDYLQQFLEDRYPFQPEFSAGTLIIANDGVALADFPRAEGRRGSSFADRDYFQSALSTRRSMIGKPFIARPMNRPAIAMSVPVLDADGRVLAVMVGAIDLSTPDFLGMATDAARLGEVEQYVLSLKDEIFVAASDKTRLMQAIPRPGQSKLMDQLRRGFDGSMIADNIYGIEKIYSTAQVPLANWIIVEAVPTSVAFRPVQLLRTTLAIGAIVGTAIALLVAAWLARRTLRPLSKASLQLEAMSSGQQDLCELPEAGTAEVRHLLASFNRLAKELITHRQHLEELVEQRTLEVSELYNRAPCGYHSLNADGIFTHVNDTELSWLGYTREELIGRMQIIDLMTPKSQALFRSLFPRFLVSGALRDQEFELVRRDGSVFPVRIEANAVFDDAGRYLFSRSIVTDNTERQDHNNALIAARDAALSADRAKSDFVANMSHEIRTPMHAVLGLVYLLEKIDLPNEARDLVRKIDRAGRLLLSIINDILDFSRIESGKLNIEHAPFDLGLVLTNIATLMAISVADKNLELIITPPAGGVAHLRGDALRLEQVLINLTNNAIKFTSTGYVNIRVDVLEAQAQRITLRFAVRDTGVGITESQQQGLFKPFTQADASTTRRFGGSGLGLAISQRLVALMGGQIGLTSTPGRGSEFWFVLPFEREDAARSSAPELAGIEVLIADDSAIATEALRITASNLGWNASTVSNGGAAIECVLGRHARQQRNDVIILDWQMPGIDGLTAARTIHESLKGQHEPIILMVTAHSRKELLALAGGGIVDGILDKPVTASTLYNTVANALRSRQAGVAPPLPPPPRPRLDGVRLLVVDDSDINREVAQRIFSGEGARVTLANNGSLALDWLRAHADEVDIVLMDVQMPVMDGYEATRLIRRTPALARLPVVALTAGAFKEQQDAAREAGMTDYIAKPFQIEPAIALLRALAGREADGAATGEARLPASTKDPARLADLPGLAIGRGMETWKDAAVYRQYLNKFIRDYGAGAGSMAQAEGAAAEALAHKLGGAASTLALTEVAAAAHSLEQALHQGAATADGCAQLQTALDTARTSIAAFAQTDAAQRAGAELPFEPDAMRSLLHTLLAAYDTDNPKEIKIALQSLAAYLPAAALAPLELAVENFDFRGGEAAVHALAAQLGIAMAG